MERLDRLFTQVAPVNGLIHFVADRLMPKTEAKAADCYDRCNGLCGSYGCCGSRMHKLGKQETVCVYGSSHVVVGTSCICGCGSQQTNYPC